jgi:hypothetical protein
MGTQVDNNGLLQINVPAAFLSIYSSRLRVVSATVDVWDPNLGARNLCIVLAGVCRNGDIAEELTKLTELHTDGALLDEEFKALKARVISQPSDSQRTKKTQDEGSKGGRLIHSRSQQQRRVLPFFWLLTRLH